MSEMRKLMKDLVEQKKKRHDPSLPEIHGDSLVPKLEDYPLVGRVFEQGHKENPSIRRKKLPKKPPPEIHGDPLELENIEPAPNENKRPEKSLDEIPIGLDEIETTEPPPLDD